VRECIDAALLVRPIDHRRGSALLDVAEDDWVVGCVGTIDQRKGADLFPALARILSSVSTSRRLVFRWLGGAPGTPEYGFAEEELARAGLAGRARFIGPLSSPADAIGRFDVHVVLSREDPYPVVMLEAAAFGRPTVCFANSGGAPEFVARGAGRVVGYLDLPAMANAILSLLLEPDPTQAARCRALAAEHDAESAAQRVSEVLFRAVGRARRGL
jgi:glycosyltransferase involved in cell wall biosynthesis